MPVIPSPPDLVVFLGVPALLVLTIIRVVRTSGMRFALGCDESLCGRSLEPAVWVFFWPCSRSLAHECTLAGSVDGGALVTYTELRGREAQGTGPGAMVADSDQVLIPWAVNIVPPLVAIVVLLIFF